MKGIVNAPPEPGQEGLTADDLATRRPADLAADPRVEGRSRDTEVGTGLRHRVERLGELQIVEFGQPSVPSTGVDPQTVPVGYDHNGGNVAMASNGSSNGRPVTRRYPQRLAGMGGSAKLQVNGTIRCGRA